MGRIGVAIAGTGFMGRTHVEALRRIDVDVIGIVGSSPAKSRQAAEQLGIGTAYDSFDDLLADPRVASVHIGTPNRHHFAMASAALAAGRHVMCEKPLAMNSTESSALVKLAAQYPQQAAGVNYNIRFYPMCIEAREQVRAGSLGRLFHVGGSYTQDWLLWPTDYNWRVLADEGGELRAIADIGTHWLDLVSSVTGLEVASVCADLSTVHAVRHRPKGEIETFSGSGSASDATEDVEITTEDQGSVLIRFQGGARGLLHVSQVFAGHKNCLRFEIAGAQQSMAWNSERPNELWSGFRDRANSMTLKDPALLTDAAAAASDYPGGHNEGYDDSFKQCFRAFYRDIESGRFATSPGFPTFADGHREICICEAIVTSARESRWIDVENATQ